MIPERPILLPMAIAAAIHLGAFLSIRSGQAPAPRPKPPAHASDTLFLLTPDTPEPEDFVPAAATIAATSPVAAPDLPDVPRTADPTGFAMLAQPFHPEADTTLTVPPAAFGPGGPGSPGRPGPLVLPATALDNEPHARYQRPPQFPFEARHEGKSGHVLVDFVVDESGRVVNPRVVSSNDARFDQPTLAAVGSWRFEPGRRQGRIVRFRLQVPVEFTLHDD